MWKYGACMAKTRNSPISLGYLHPSGFVWPEATLARSPTIQLNVGVPPAWKRIWFWTASATVTGSLTRLWTAYARQFSTSTPICPQMQMETPWRLLPSRYRLLGLVSSSPMVAQHPQYRHSPDEGRCLHTHHMLTAPHHPHLCPPDVTTPITSTRDPIAARPPLRGHRAPIRWKRQTCIIPMPSHPDKPGTRLYS